MVLLGRVGQFLARRGLRGRRIYTYIRSLPAMTVGDTATCHLCKTVFNSRLALVTHLSETRVRSKIRNTSCGIMFHKNPLPLLDVERANELNDRDRLLRKTAAKDGHSHHLARVPAQRISPQASKGVPARLISQLQADGARRRLSSKTKQAIGQLLFKPRNYVL